MIAFTWYILFDDKIPHDQLPITSVSEDHIVPNDDESPSQREPTMNLDGTAQIWEEPESVN